MDLLSPKDMWRLPNLVRRANLASQLSRVSRLNGCGRMKGRLTKICNCTNTFNCYTMYRLARERISNTRWPPPGDISEAVGARPWWLTIGSIVWCASSISLSMSCRSGGGIDIQDIVPDAKLGNQGATKVDLLIGHDGGRSGGRENTTTGNN